MTLFDGNSHAWRRAPGVDIVEVAVVIAIEG